MTKKRVYTPQQKARQRELARIRKLTPEQLERKNNARRKLQLKLTPARKDELRIKEKLRSRRRRKSPEYKAAQKTPEFKAKVNLRMKKMYAANPLSFNERAKKYRRTNMAHTLITEGRRRAKKLGIQFTLTFKDITVPSHCPLLGIPLSIGDGGPHNGSPSLDRFESSGFYEPSNVWVISHRANRLKSDGTIEELEMIARNLRIRKFRTTSHKFIMRSA